jgi:hypothetical protein
MENVFEGIQMDLTGTREVTFDYMTGDMEVAYRRTNPNSWQDIISWLEKQGTRDNELTPGEVVAMVEDLRTLEDKDIPFTDNPDKAFQEAHRYREENNKNFTKNHKEIHEASTKAGQEKH